MGLIGGTLTGPLIFILPPLFYSKITQMEEIYDEEVETIRAQHDTDEYEPFDDGIVFSTRIVPIGSNRAVSRFKRFKLILREYSKFMFNDCLISILVIIFGLFATLISTYCNIFDVSSLIQWSPCLNRGNFSFIKF